MELKMFEIPVLTGFVRNENNAIVPVLKKSRKRASRETLQYPQIISNLVNYDGYHLLLSTEANPFTALNAFTSGMGLAYIDDELKLCEPFGFNRLKGKIFVGICIEDWDEFKEDIFVRDSRYYRFLGFTDGSIHQNKMCGAIYEKRDSLV